MADQPQTMSRFRSGAIAAVITALFVGGYAMYEHGQANRYAAQNQQVEATLHSTQAQVEAMNAKMSDMAAQQQAVIEAQQREAARREAIQRASMQRSAHSARHVRRDDPRWKQFQSKLDEQGQAIESTRQDLSSAKTELNGSIARTHDEVVLLQKKGERNYYEFDLSKAKQFQRTGPFAVKLKKANTKHQFADLDLIVDDANLQKKHVNLYEPVVFYATDSGMPAELVIQSIDKNHIRGYVSEPKYKRSELASTASDTQNNAQDTTTTASAAPRPPRRKLELPK